MDLEILYEDPDLTVVVKPAGLVVHPAGRHLSGTLANGLAYRFNVEQQADPPRNPGMVHRLDRATSGVMVVARTQRALSILTIQFQRREVTKEYLALVHGHLPGEAGDWYAPIGNDPLARPKWGIRPEGRPAHSRWWVEHTLPHYSLLRMVPVTGRTNQLRLHAAHFGFPICGDDLFGRGACEHPTPGRLFLHADRLGFRHPTTRETLEFSAPLPQALVAFVTRVQAIGNR